jgi:hypothetical protein
LTEPERQNPVPISSAWPRVGSEHDLQLMAEGEILQEQIRHLRSAAWLPSGFTFASTAQKTLGWMRAGACVPTSSLLLEGRPRPGTTLTNMWSFLVD